MKQNFPFPEEAAFLAARLSERQRECLLLVKDGFTSKEIGRLLSLSPSTVDNHINGAIERLGCSSRAVAAQILDAARRAENHNSAQEKGRNNTNHSDGYADHVHRAKPAPSYVLPPLGGAENKETRTRRIAHIGLVTIAATMVFAAITITIAGIIALFSE